MSKSSLISKISLFAVLAVFLLASTPFQALAEEFRSPADGIQLMRYEEGLVSLEANNASLDKILSEIARMAMISIIADGPIEGRVTLYADRLRLEKALRRILRGKDTSFVYAAKAETSPAEYEVREVRIYLAKADKGEARRYSYANRKDRQKASRPARPSRAPSKRRGSRSPSTSPRIPQIANSADAERLVSELMEGNLDGLNEIAERLRDENPQVEEQIDEFLDSLEEARIRAEESGQPIPPLDGLGNMQTLMQQMLRGGRGVEGDE